MMEVVVELSDAQWCLMDVLMRADEAGAPEVHRMELLRSQAVPQGVALQLTWAALSMPKDLIEWTGQHTFRVTEKGRQAFRERFTGRPTKAADAVICLPDLSRTVN